MARRKKKPKSLKQASQKKKTLPGISLEKAVARIQQMLDPQSKVSPNEKLIDRYGIKRQCDVVIRGTFAGRSVLGIVECKDHNKRKGPDAIEAFSKKCDNLGANLRLMVSRKGFTESALLLAKKEGIGCLSFLPGDPGQVGFGVGDWWYGIIGQWANLRLRLHFATEAMPAAGFRGEGIRWEGRPIIDWYWKELLTTYRQEATPGDFTLHTTFDEIRNLEVEGKAYPVKEITCIVTRVIKKKRKWVNWSGDALLDWHTGQFTVPDKGIIVGSAVESDLSLWEDYEGDIPGVDGPAAPGFMSAVIWMVPQWDETREVVDLNKL